MNKHWYYRNKSEKVGPLSEEEFVSCIQNQIIQEEDEIWTKGMKHWLALKDSIYNFYFMKFDTLTMEDIEEKDDEII
ncbi:DUF4339 domain-containing protein [Erysipelotrichaceae bacterium OH741_COT-311]|nr:DUF4339 domain-containing protein [Erysipelotrichaceae bacterium OH741_COT-311]